jgi:hypothetical protein
MTVGSPASGAAACVCVDIVSPPGGESVPGRCDTSAAVPAVVGAFRILREVLGWWWRGRAHDQDHDFFSGSGSSYVIGKAVVTEDEDWNF